MPEPVTDQSEVVEEVLTQIKTFGDDTKKNYNELRKNYEELKVLVEGNSKDMLSQEKLEKFASDVSTRQKSLDDDFAKKSKEAQERLDKIEVAMKRPNQNVSNGEDLEAEAKEFLIHSLAAKSGEGVKPEAIAALKSNVSEYEAYKKAFTSWARSYGGTNNRLASDIDVKALQVGIDSDGGLTVPVSMSNKIIKRTFESDPIRQLASVESITSGALEWLVDIDEAGYVWEGETTGETTITDETSTPKFRKKRIVAHVISVNPTATQTLLEDSGINIENWLSNKIAQRFLRGEGAGFVSGDGIGKPRGFLSYDDGTEWGTVEQVAMGAAAALTADGFIDVKYALKEFFLERGTWLMNRTTVQAAMKLKTGAGDYIWKPSMIVSDPSSAILNLPVRMSTTMPAVAADTLSIALADWAEAYMIVDRLGITAQRDPYSNKPFIEFYTRKRLGGDVINYDAIKIGKISA